MDDDTISLVEKQAGMGYKQIEIVCGECKFNLQSTLNIYVYGIITVNRTMSMK